MSKLVVVISRMTWKCTASISSPKSTHYRQKIMSLSLGDTTPWKESTTANKQNNDVDFESANQKRKKSRSEKGDVEKCVRNL